MAARSEQSSTAEAQENYCNNTFMKMTEVFKKTLRDIQTKKWMISVNLQMNAKKAKEKTNR